MKPQLEKLSAAIAPADARAMQLARERQEALVKPPGSLGRLEEIAVRMAGITGKVCNDPKKMRLVVFAADNGVVEEGVSGAPQSVTLQQTVNLTRGITGASALAAHVGAEVVVVDVGVAAEIACTAVQNRKIAYGTRNLFREPAMTEEQALRAIMTGAEYADFAAKDGIQLAGCGEMGIGNTTTSAAVLCALLGRPAADIAGKGGGMTQEAYEKKLRVIDGALALHHPNPENVLAVLAAVGGLDLCAMTGFFLGCARNRIPAVVDGIISITAALAAVRINARVRDYLFLSHRSFEKGYTAAARELQLHESLDLEMRLGEGSGCPLMFQVIAAACAAMRSMATFSEAAINDDYLAEIRRIDAFTVEENPC